MTWDYGDYGFYEFDTYVIYVNDYDDHWKTTHHSFDTEKDAEDFISSGNMRSLGKKFGIVHEIVKHHPMKKFFIREKYSSQKETPRRASQKLSEVAEN